MSPASRVHTRTSWTLGSVVDNALFFTWWIRAQRAVNRWSVRRRAWLLGGCIGLGVSARLWAQALPGNWDFDQWVNVSTAVLEGRDPYLLYGYNYPPPWLATLTGLNAATSSPGSFRLMISILLIAADVGIALLLARRGYVLASAVFLLSPILIAITGQHQQIEGIAVFLALAAMLLLGASPAGRFGAREWAGVLLLGLSLSFKPVFLLLPLWLALQPGGWQRRLFRMFAPLAVFALIFATAFLAYPADVVVDRVLLHGGANNSPFINQFVPQQLAPWVLEHGGGKVAFVALLIAAGWYFRHRPPFELALVYTISALLFSWAVVNQYLATPMAAVAVYLNLGLLTWFAMAVVFLGGTQGVLNLWGLRTLEPHLFGGWEKAMQDFFPWLLFGWILLAIAAKLPGRLMGVPDARRAGDRDRPLTSPQ